jgi:hypothetical protein
MVPVLSMGCLVSPFYCFQSKELKLAIFLVATRLCADPIEIGLEQAPFVFLIYFFPHLNM